MKKFLVTSIISVISLAAIAHTIKLEYGEFEKDLQRLADFEEIQLLKVRLSVDSVGKEYDLVAVTVSPDSITEQLVSTVLPIKLLHDTTEYAVFAKPLGNDSVKIQVAGSNYHPTIHKMPTSMCILFNYTSQDEFESDDEIPLFVYAPGAEFEMEWEGQKVKGYHYCQVRDCGKHPSQWGKAFGLPTYVYYVLRPKIFISAFFSN